MKGVLRSCVLAFVLGCKVTTAIIHEIIQEKNPARMKCPHPVEGDVTWSRERNGSKEDILTVHGDTETKHINDPQRRYNHEGFTSLYITRVKISDTGRYFCNDEAAVDLTVIPSGTVIYNAAEMDTVTLNCSTGVGGSTNATWSKDGQEIKQGGQFFISSIHRTLKIRKVQPADSGLYYCDGKPAAYLRVTKGDQSDRGKKTENTTTTTLPTTRKTEPTATFPTSQPPSSTTTTNVPTTTPLATTVRPTTVKPVASSTLTENKRTATAASTTTTPTPTPTPTPKTDLILTAAVPSLLFLLLLFFLFLIIVYFRRRRSKKQGKDEGHIYDEIQDGSVCLDKIGDPNQNDHTYHTISYLPLVVKQNDTSLQTESPYSLLGDGGVGGNHQGNF